MVRHVKTTPDKAMPACLLLAVALTVAVSGCSSPGSSAVGQHEPGASLASGTPASSIGAPVPPSQACEEPATPNDLRLGQVAIVEATVAHGKATSDGAGGVVIPLEGAKLLWGSVSPTPSAIEADNLPLEDADLLLDAGRYILFLGSSTPGHYYLAQGRFGAFSYSDSAGNLLTRNCTQYYADGKGRPPVKAKASISRKALLGLASQAPAG